MFVGLPESYGNAPLLFLGTCAVGLGCICSDTISKLMSLKDMFLLGTGPSKWGCFSMPHFLSVFKIFHSVILGMGFVSVKAEHVGKMFGAS